MAHFLIHRFGSKDKPQFRKDSYSTEPDAVIVACGLLATGDEGHFRIEDENGKVVTHDAEIRSRCKISRTP